MPTITIYSKEPCPYCVWAKELLTAKGATYTEIRVDLDPAKRDEMLTRSNGQRTVPQIFIDDLHVGGFDDLSALDKAGTLNTLLK
jgi:glutaredoxin 3